MNENDLLHRITIDPKIFGGKPIIRGRRLAVEHVLGMLAAGDSMETLLEGYSWLERDDILACLVYAPRYAALLDAADELEAIRAYDEAKAAGDEMIPFVQAVQEIEAQRSS